MRPTPATLDPAAASAGLPSPAAVPARPDHAADVRRRLLALPHPTPELLALLGLAALLYLWNLSRNGWANTYYSAAVRSMSGSWHDFLFASFDPAGLMTVDKPPLALWVQALSVRAFGFDSLAILVPQALMGMASAALVYDLTRRRFGRAAGFIAGLVLVLTPVTIATSRHNNPDALLVLCCVAALWLLVRGLEDGRTRWLVLSGVCVGLGFETKMAVALMVVPGIAAAWLWIAPRGRGRRRALRQLLAGGAAMTAVALAWPVLVWLTPAADRPWVGSSSDNSIWSLILGYNGLGRLDGQAGGPGAGGPGGAGGGPGGGVGPFGGEPGPLRLLNASLGGQAGWLLGIALVGALGLVVTTRLRRSDPRTGWLLAVGGGFAAIAVAFSFARGIFHPYYVSLLAPFAAALVGATVGEIRRDGAIARILAPVAVAGGVASSLAVLHSSGDLGWLEPLLVAGGIVAAVALALPAAAGGRIRSVVLAAILALLLVAPATWAVQTLGHATSGTFPAGGPADAGMRLGPGGPGGRGRPGRGPRVGGMPRSGGPPMGGIPGGPGPRAGGMPAVPPMGAANGAGVGRRGGPTGAGGPGAAPFGGDPQSLTQALAYVGRHGGGTIGVSSQQGASAAIIASGADVAGIGGFSGRESEVSVAWLASAVRDGRLAWVLADAGGDRGALPNDGRRGSSAAMTAVRQACTAVTLPGAAGSSPSRTSAAAATATLYDCRTKAAVLAALA